MKYTDRHYAQLTSTTEPKTVARDLSTGLYLNRKLTGFVAASAADAFQMAHANTATAGAINRSFGTNWDWAKVAA